MMDKATGKQVPVLVGLFSYLLWGTCQGVQDLKYYDDIQAIVPWIYKYVPKDETCQFGTKLEDHRKCTYPKCIIELGQIEDHFPYNLIANTIHIYLMFRSSMANRLPVEPLGSMACNW